MKKNQHITINNRHYVITGFDETPYDKRGHQCVNLVDIKGNVKYAIFRNGIFEQWQRSQKANIFSRVKGMKS